MICFAFVVEGAYLEGGGLIASRIISTPFGDIQNFNHDDPTYSLAD